MDAELLLTDWFFVLLSQSDPTASRPVRGKQLASREEAAFPTTLRLDLIEEPIPPKRQDQNITLLRMHYVAAGGDFSETDCEGGLASPESV